jgi:hypothetical protein
VRFQEWLLLVDTVHQFWELLLQTLIPLFYFELLLQKRGLMDNFFVCFLEDSPSHYITYCFENYRFKPRISEVTFSVFVHASIFFYIIFMFLKG